MEQEKSVHTAGLHIMSVLTAKPSFLLTNVIFTNVGNVHNKLNMHIYQYKP